MASAIEFSKDLEELKLPQRCDMIVTSFIQPTQVFTPLCSTTTTVMSHLTNVSFHEKDLIFLVDAVGAVKKIGCNYGIIYNDTYKEVGKKKKSNRGRKPANKPRPHRKLNGNGKFFNSQISFYIKCDVVVSKIYEVKVFRTGGVELLGILDPEYKDAQAVIRVIKDTLSKCFEESIGIGEVVPVMRNYKFRICDINLRVNLYAMRDILISTKDVCDTSVLEVRYNPERYPALITTLKYDKNTTIKIFKSGKVNMVIRSPQDQGKDFFYEWLNTFMITYASKILYYPRAVESSSSDED